MAQSGNAMEACVIMAVIIYATLFLVLDSDIQGNAEGSKDPDGEVKPELKDSTTTHAQSDINIGTDVANHAFASACQHMSHNGATHICVVTSHARLQCPDAEQALTPHILHRTLGGSNGQLAGS